MKFPIELERILNRPWLYVLVSLIHQILILLPGPFPQTFPDTGTYLIWHQDRTPIYPWVLQTLPSLEAVAALQVLFFAATAGLFFVLLRNLLNHWPPGKTLTKPYVLWIGSLYFATNFELLQYSPSLLTESLGISLILVYFWLIDKTLQPSRGKSLRRNLENIFVFLVFPALLFLLRPSFLLVPLAVSAWLGWTCFWKQKPRHHIFIPALGILSYLCLVGGYAVWNKSRLGHVGISDVLQHQIFANYMAQGVLTEEAQKPEASETLKSFAATYEVTRKHPEGKESQYLLFEEWKREHPDKNFYSELVLVNREMLSKRFGSYIRASLRNFTVLIDGRASFNYLIIDSRPGFTGVLYKAYFLIQRGLDHLFAFFWFVSLYFLIRYFKDLKKSPLLMVILVAIGAQFFTISFFGYSELRRQAIGVGSLQMLMVIGIWARTKMTKWSSLLDSNQ